MKQKTEDPERVTWTAEKKQVRERTR